MTDVALRPMTAEEYATWREALARDYASSQVDAGRWDAEGAVERALADTDARLPHGVDTDGMRLVVGVDAVGDRVGHAWLALDPEITAAGIAFLFDIEVDASRRGAGLGRGLLTALERAAHDAGATALELNVFGANRIARGLYEAAGYEVVTQQMRKPLGQQAAST